MTIQAVFQSTLPAGEATQRSVVNQPLLEDFNPRFPRGKRRDKKEAYLDAYKFQSTPPAGEATRKSRPGLTSPTFQSTLPVGEATEEVFPSIPQVEISIHASRGGSDPAPVGIIQVPIYFNPRFPRGKRLRGLDFRSRKYYFNPRFPRGKRPMAHLALR